MRSDNYNSQNESLAQLSKRFPYYEDFTPQFPGIFSFSILWRKAWVSAVQQKHRVNDTREPDT